MVGSGPRVRQRGRPGPVWPGASPHVILIRHVTRERLCVCRGRGGRGRRSEGRKDAGWLVWVRRLTGSSRARLSAADCRRLRSHRCTSVRSSYYWGTRSQNYVLFDDLSDRCCAALRAGVRSGDELVHAATAAVASSGNICVLNDGRRSTSSSSFFYVGVSLSLSLSVCVCASGLTLRRLEGEGFEGRVPESTSPPSASKLTTSVVHGRRSSVPAAKSSPGLHQTLAARRVRSSSTRLSVRLYRSVVSGLLPPFSVDL